MSFGWSASDISTLVVAIYRVVENCREGVTSASQQIKSFQTDLQEFSAVLVQLQKHVAEANDVAFLDLRDVKKTIEDCNIYLDKYKHLHLQLTSDGDRSPTSRAAGNDGPSSKRRSSLSKSKDLLGKSKEASLKYGEAFKYTAWGGDQELHVLQTKLTRHRQTLVLYIQILERRKRAEENSTLLSRFSSVEAMVKDLHSSRSLSAIESPEIQANSQQQSHHEDYESILQAVNEQKSLAILGTEEATNDERLEEWNDILSQLEFIHRRVLNAAERTANSKAQRRSGSISYQISLNRMLAARTSVATSSPTLVARRDTDDSGFYDLPPVREESGGLDESSFRILSAKPDPRPLHAIAQSAPSNMFPMTPSSVLKMRASSVHNQERPYFSPRSSAESVFSHGQHSTQRGRGLSHSSSEASIATIPSYWKNVEMDGWVKLSCSEAYGQVPCCFRAGYDINDRVYMLQAMDVRTNSTLVILKLATKSKRPVPHTEPPGDRDKPEDGFCAYFIDPPDTEPPTADVQFFFQNQPALHQFESIIYGQKLLLSVLAEKIASSSDKLSDRQWIRVWKQDDRTSLLFYASKVKKRYLSISAGEVVAPHKILKTTTLELSVTNRHLQSSSQSHSKSFSNLKITFGSRVDLDQFVKAFLSS